jgi:hypothetical protein
LRFVGFSLDDSNGFEGFWSDPAGETAGFEGDGFRLNSPFDFLPDDFDDGLQFRAVEAFVSFEVDRETDVGNGAAFFIPAEGLVMPVGVRDFQIIALKISNPLFPLFRGEGETSGDEFAESDAEVLLNLAIHFSEGEFFKRDLGDDGEPLSFWSGEQFVPEGDEAFVLKPAGFFFIGEGVVLQLFDLVEKIFGWRGAGHQAGEKKESQGHGNEKVAEI